MENALVQALERVDEFFARDFVYICGGLLVSICCLNGIGVLEPIIGYLDQSNSSWVILLFAFPLMHVIGYSTRELVGFSGMVTTKELDGRILTAGKGTITPVDTFFVFRLRKYFLHKNSPGGASGDSSEIIDNALGEKKNSLRQYRLYTRAIFLKEILATTGNSALFSGLVLMICALNKYWVKGSSPAEGTTLVELGAVLLVVGFVSCRFSVYQAFRQGGMVVKIGKFNEK